MTSIENLEKQITTIEQRFTSTITLFILTETMLVLGFSTTLNSIHIFIPYILSIFGLVTSAIFLLLLISIEKEIQEPINTLKNNNKNFKDTITPRIKLLTYLIPILFIFTWSVFMIYTYIIFLL